MVTDREDPTTFDIAENAVRSYPFRLELKFQQAVVLAEFFAKRSRSTSFSALA